MANGSAPPIVVQSGSNPLNLVLGIAGLGLLGVGIYKGKQYLDKQSAASQLKKDQASTVKPAPGKKMFDLNGKPITGANLATIATELEDALSFPVDNARAVRVFKNTPFGYVDDLEAVYLNKFGEQLRDRMVQKLKDQYWIQVKFWFK